MLILGHTGADWLEALDRFAAASTRQCACLLICEPADFERVIQAACRPVVDCRLRGPGLVEQVLERSMLIMRTLAAAAVPASDPHVREELYETRMRQTLGHMARRMSEQFTNLLGGIIGYADLQREALPPESRGRQYAEGIKETAMYAADLLKQALKHTERFHRHLETVAVDRMLREIEELLGSALGPETPLQLVLQAKSATVHGDPRALQGAVWTLCLHLRQSFAREGRLAIRTQLAVLDDVQCASYPDELEPGSYVMITIARESEDFPGVLEPAEGEEGEDYDLFSVYGCLRHHHGTVVPVCHGNASGGFRVLLPLVSEAEELDANTAPVRRILIVDPDTAARDILCEGIEQTDFDVLACGSGADAVRAFREHHEEIELMLIERELPDTAGADLCHALHAIDPRVRAVYIGHEGSPAPGAWQYARGAAVLVKPFLVADVARLIRRTISRS